jgi:AcrR family transcriptional regulator
MSVLASDGIDALTVDRIAVEAGLSARTVYRYFPDREALLQATSDDYDASMPYTPPSTADDVATVFEQLFPAFDTDADAIRASLVARLSGAIRWRGRERRVAEITGALREVTADLPPDDAREAAAVITYLASSLAWMSMADESGLDGAASGRAVGWAIRTLVSDLRSRNANKPTRRRLPKEDA